MPAEQGISKGRFAAVTPEDLPKVRQFLAAVFETADDAPFLNPRLFEWKCFEARPDWPGSRGFLLSKGESLLAYATIVPGTWLTDCGPVSSVLPIDWAADPSIPGAGTVLHRKMRSLSKVALHVGGTAQARQLVPHLGLGRHAAIELFSRVLRPFRQYGIRPQFDYKAPLRLARNVVWSLTRLPRAPRRWTAEGIDGFEDGMLPDFSRRVGSCFTAPARGAALLNYMLRCPGARLSAYLVKEAGATRGFFVLAHVGGQTRIADLLLDSTEAGDWTAGYALALGEAARNPRTCEVTAAASTPLGKAALLDAGFRSRGYEPVWIGDPEHALPEAAPLHISMLEWDGAYLYNPSDPFLS
jgi:hypothetical protein